MADYVSTPTDKAVIDADEVTQFEQGIIFGVTPELIVDQAATIKTVANAKTIQFAIYANLTAISSVITDGEDVTPVALADSTNTIVPLEYGNAVVVQEGANFESGGKAWAAAGFLIGRNMGTSLDGLGMTILEAFSTTRIYPNTASAVTNLATTDNLDRVFANRLYNKLARTNVLPIGGSYIGIAHDDCLHDLRVDGSTGGWIDVSKYADAQSALKNEVGMYAGIRWLRSSNVTVTSDSNGTIDSYKVNVLGFNALGKGQNYEPQVILGPAYDLLNRFKSAGWKWSGAYKVIDTANMVQGLVASSVGSN
jgi:N4-gp56 family major capsid protein